MTKLHRGEGTKIYTARFGEVKEGSLLNETPKGYRVKGGQWGYEHVVYRFKQFAGWEDPVEKGYFQEQAFTDKQAAEDCAARQLIAREQYFKRELEKIQEAKKRAGVLL